MICQKCNLPMRKIGNRLIITESPEGPSKDDSDECAKLEAFYKCDKCKTIICVRE